MAVRTHYEILGVSPCADVEIIKQAFRKAVKAHHPDLRGGPDAAADRHVKMIIAAYRVLRDPDLRAEYDALLAEARDRARSERWNAIFQFTAMTAVLSVILIGVELLFLPEIHGWMSTASLRSIAMRMRPRAPEPALAPKPAATPESRADTAPVATARPAGSPMAFDAGPDDRDIPPIPPAAAAAHGEITSPGDEEQTAAVSSLDHGVDLSRRDDLDRAIADFDAAIRLWPDNAQAYRYRGRVWSRKGDLDRAIADLDVAIRLDPKNPGLLHDRGLIRQQRGEFDEALVDLDHAVRMSFSDAEIYSDRAAVWLAKGSYDRALADLDQALKLNPQLLSAVRRRDEALERKHERDHASESGNVPPALRDDITGALPNPPAPPSGTR
ncbi:conserved hypothetical protein [Bradyrhizobium sp. STM 3843]|uniref:J domain-containing protein n=1 Tax=Bradyrhizobium sp. STM 3843 TaxID=551947 RepID=UPI000240B016|nr:tetratricopeptide repeat protein [Bradyrhizobium sp. STM 3843]CCE06579.1 conserved hypothetical protein [Bradyrhizobium sp. STM 3843]